jgi:hypothetical protein
MILIPWQKEHLKKYKIMNKIKLHPLILPSIIGAIVAYKFFKPKQPMAGIGTVNKDKEIEDLVDYALSDISTNNMFVSLGLLTTKQVRKIKAVTNLDLSGYEIVIDKSAVRHTIKNHGNIKTEKLRGQIAVTEKDFNLIPTIITTGKIKYLGVNKVGRDIIEYEAKINDAYYCVQEVRTKKRTLALQTMYKRKTTL